MPASKRRAARSDGPPPLKVYISYSNRDRKLLDQLVTHLEPLVSEGTLDIFYDRLLAPGTKWIDELMDRLTEASIVLFLVSPDSLSSEYIERELHSALSHQESKRIIPVLLRPCDWFSSPLSKFTALPRDAKPVTTWKNRNEAFDDVAQGIRAVIESLRGDKDDSRPSSHSAAVRRVAVSPDGARAVSASDDGSAMVWDLSTMRSVLMLAGHDAAVTDVEFTRDGTRVITSSKDSTVRIWDLGGGKELSTLKGHEGEIAAFAVTENDVVTAYLDSSLLVWAQDTGVIKTEAVLRPAEVSDIVAGSRRNTFVSAHRDGRCRMWDYGDGLRMIDESKVSAAPIREIRASPDAVSYTSCCENGSVQVFTFPDAVREFTISTMAISGIAPLPDGRHAVAACADGALRICDLTTGAVIREYTLHGPSPTAVAVTPDGKRVIWASAGGTVSALPLDTSVQRPLPQGRERLKLAYLAVLEMPELWRVLETFDEAALSGIAAELLVPPDKDLLQFLVEKHPNVEPPPLWSAWMETLHQDKLGKTRAPR